MRAAAVLVVSVVTGALAVGACGGDDDHTAGTDVASTTPAHGEQIVVRTRIRVADQKGAEPIATGRILAGATLGGISFCMGGRILDSHASFTVERYGPIERTITCPDGTVRMALRPDVSAPPGEIQRGRWTIVGGTGAFEALRGSGKLESVSDRDDSRATETLTGTVRR